MINTPTVVINARVTLPMMLYQMMKVAIATAITAGTNQPVTWSIIAELVLWNPALVEPIHNLGKTYLYLPGSPT